MTFAVAAEPAKIIRPRELVRGKIETDAAGCDSKWLGAGGAEVAALIVIAIFQATIWSLGALLAVDDLHRDTLEIIAWSNELAMGYPKHPPVASWLLHFVLELPGTRILNLLAFSQLGALTAAFFIWRTVRLYASPRFATLAVLFYLASPAASFFSLQINHNSILIPFATATVFYGLRYLEGRATIDAALLGLAAGMSFLAKYEIAFHLLSLVSISVAVPRFRKAWADWRSPLAVAVFAAVISPHILWDWRHGWTTWTYASEARPLATLGDLGKSANELLDGLAMAAIGPVLTLLFVARLRFSSNASGRAGFGLFLAASPMAALVATSLVTRQIIRQGWLVPLVPIAIVGIVIALASRFETVAPDGKPWTGLAARGCILSVAQLCALFAFMAARTLMGHPVEAFSFDSSEFAEELRAVWRARDAGPLECFASPAGNMWTGPVLYMDPLPRIIDLASAQVGSSQTLPPCGDTGGVFVIGETDVRMREIERFNLASTVIDVATEQELGGFRWRIKVYFVPRADSTSAR